jgi:hypothetical protein
MNIKNIIFSGSFLFATLLGAQTVELSGIAGQKFSSNYPIVNGSTTYINIPLPAGEWTVIRGNEWVVQNTSKKMREIFLINTMDKSINGAIQKSVRYAIYVNTTIDSTSTRWLDEPCKGEDFIYSNKYNSGMWDQRCLTIRQEGYLARSDNKVQQIARNYLDKNNISYVTSRIQVKYMMYNRAGKFIELTISVFPTDSGFEKPNEGVDSPWHLSSYRKDPEKIKFIESLRIWAEKYSDAIYSNFMSDKPLEISVPKFNYPSDVISVETAPSETASVKEKLGKLKELFDAKLITEQDYDKKRKEILSAL